MGELCKSLRDDHRIIERVLNAMASESVRLDNGYTVNADFVRSALAFMRDFIGGFHHRKEEQIVFRQLERAGFPRGNGPIDDLVTDHKDVKLLIAAIEADIEAAAIGDGQAISSLAENVRRCVTLERRHIEQEENLLFQMAEQMVMGSGRIEAERALIAADESIDDTVRRNRAWAESLGHPECPSYETEKAELLWEESEMFV